MKKPLAVFALLCLGVTSTTAQNLETQTQERQRQLQAHYNRITSTDTMEAISATEVGLQSGDAGLRSMTLETALGHANMRVQTTALRWVLSVQKSLLLRLAKPSGTDKGDQYTYELWQGFVLKKFKFNPDTDEITRGGLHFDGGQLVRGGIELHYNWTHGTKGFRCVIFATVDREATTQGYLQLKGEIDCVFPSSKRHGAKGDQDGTGAFTMSLS